MTLDRRCQTKVEEIPIFSRLLEAIINNVMVANYMVHYHVGYFCFMENILYNVFQRAKVLSNENLGKTESLYLGRMTLSLTEKKHIILYQNLQMRCSTIVSFHFPFEFGSISRIENKMRT